MGHLKMQKEKKFHCPECTFSTNAFSSIRNHLLTHSGEKPHACPICPKRFIWKALLRRHIRVHTGEKEHTCGTCGKTFTQKSTLTIHERTHSGEKPYRCTDCGKGFAYLSYLNKHSMQHTQQKPYPCPHCELSFNVKSTLGRHITRLHTRVFPHNCSLCGKGYCRPGELKIHAEREHGENVKLELPPKPYPCPHCELRFTVKGSLDRHITRLHTRVFPHNCSLCGKGYCRPGELKAHAEREHGKNVKLKV